MKHQLRLWAALSVFLLGGCADRPPAGQPPFSLDAKDIAWGKSQVEMMVRDRPAMARFAVPGDPVWNWAVREFAGEWVKDGVEWDASDPKPLWDSLCTLEKEKRSRIQVTKKSTFKNSNYGRLKEGPTLWFQTVFELCNLRFYPQAEAINSQAYYGKISREEFCFRRFYLEDIVTRRAVHDFFLELWVPNCQRLHQEPWDKTLIENGNRDIPVYSPKEFIDRYFSVDYTASRQKDNVGEDFSFHHLYFAGVYDQNFLPWMEKMKVPAPPAEPLDRLKGRMEKELEK